jgi:hypothetical protein
MTIGDIIEKILGLFHVEPGKIRKLRERVSAIGEKIQAMEDGLRDVRKKVSGIEDRIEDLKRELKLETSVHNQDIIMDEIERIERDLGRQRELANLKGGNVEAAYVLRSKLEQLMETAVNGGNTAELEDVLLKVESMDEELSDVRNLVSQLDKPTKAAYAGRPAAKSKTEDADRAARRARILGEKMPAQTSETASNQKKGDSRAEESASKASSDSSDSSSTVPGVTVAQ